MSGLVGVLFREFPVRPKVGRHNQDRVLLMVAEPGGYRTVKHLGDSVNESTFTGSHDNHGSMGLCGQPAQSAGGITGKDPQGPRNAFVLASGGYPGLQILCHRADFGVVRVGVQGQPVSGAGRIPFHQVACLVHVTADQVSIELHGQGGGRIQHLRVLSGKDADHQGLAVGRFRGHTLIVALSIQLEKQYRRLSMLCIMEL